VRVTIGFTRNTFSRVDGIANKKWFTLLALQSLSIIVALNTIIQFINSRTIAVTVALTRLRTIASDITYQSSNLLIKSTLIIMKVNKILTEIALTNIGFNTCAKNATLITNRSAMIGFHYVSVNTFAHKAILEINAFFVCLVTSVTTAQTFIFFIKIDFIILLLIKHIYSKF
jgi:hypothetical protein